MEGEMVIHRSNQTGDIPHVAAVLALAPKTGVFVVLDPDPKPDASKPDAPKPNDLLLQFYKKVIDITKNPVIGYQPKPAFTEISGIDYDTVEQQTWICKTLYDGMLVESEDNNLDWTQDAAYIKQYGISQGMNLNGFSDALRPFSGWRPATVGRATSIVANQFKGDKKTVYTTLAKAVASALTTDEILKDMSNWKAIKESPNWKPETTFPFPTAPTYKPILLVWSRYTGQNNPDGYNPAGDSDPRGQEQLIEIGKELGFTVVAIGHGPVEGRKATKVKPDVHLGEFYKEDIIQKQGRAGQMSFFLALLEKCPGRIIQVGQKTGGMDSAALLGMPTLYIEDKGSSSATRMVKWVNRVPFYQRADIESPPTPLGKALRGLKGTFQPPRTQTIPLRFRVLTWVWILINNKNSVTQVHLKALEDAIGKPLQGNIKAMEIMLRNLGIGDEIFLKWLNGMQTLSPEELDKAKITSGYSPDDLKLIKGKLSELKENIRKPESIVRNQAGVYVKLSEVK